MKRKNRFGISLDPLTVNSNCDITNGYPRLLPPETKMGYFGEVFAGIIAENFKPLGLDNWRVPAYLFRFHTVAFQYLESRHQGIKKSSKIIGRHGDDCLAFREDTQGNITQALVCEAKCLSQHVASSVKEAHEKISSAETLPIDLRNVMEVLCDRNDTESKKWHERLRKLYLQNTFQNYERCDMVCYICGDSPKTRDSWMQKDKPHTEYRANRRLEAVEIHLNGVGSFVMDLYDALQF